MNITKHIKLFLPNNIINENDSEIIQYNNLLDDNLIVNCFPHHSIIFISKLFNILLQNSDDIGYSFSISDNHIITCTDNHFMNYFLTVILSFIFVLYNPNNHNKNCFARDSFNDFFNDADTFLYCIDIDDYNYDFMIKRIFIEFKNDWRISNVFNNIKCFPSDAPFIQLIINNINNFIETFDNALSQTPILK